MTETTQMLVWGAIVVAALALLAVLSAFSPQPLETFTFYTFGGTMAISALAILFTNNIVRAATWLFFTLGAAAALYILLAANFLAAVQLIVYAGGILILIVFGVMLTARGPYVRFTVPTHELVLAASVAGVLFLTLTILLLQASPPPLVAPETVGQPVAVRDIGHALLTTWLLPFEIVSVLLLSVMIGAAYLARPTER